MRNRFLLPKVFAFMSLCAAAQYGLVNRASAYSEKDGPIKNGTLIPTGVRITPDAAPGSTFVPLNPGLASDPSFTVGQAVTTAISPDGKTLLILTSGYNSQNFTSGPNAGDVNPAESNEYIFVFDLTGGKPLETQVLQIPNAFDGLVWNPNSNEFYASGGTSDNIHVFAGYNLLYWNNVLRAGDQITRSVNSGEIPSNANFDPAFHPTPVLRRSRRRLFRSRSSRRRRGPGCSSCRSLPRG